MGWGKLDDNLHDHPKVDELNDVAPLGLWTVCLTWAHRHRRTRSDPSFVPWGTVDRLGRRKSRTYSKELLRVGLWEDADGGIRIHDFGDYLPGGSDEERSEKARKAARARWDSAQGDANEHAPEHGASNADALQDAMPENAPRASCAGSDSLSSSSEELPTPTPIRKTRRKAATKCPDKIEITDSMREWADEHAPGVRLVAESMRLVNWAHGNDARKSDWVAAWRNWMLKAQSDLNEKQLRERNRFGQLAAGDEEWMR